MSVRIDTLSVHEVTAEDVSVEHDLYNSGTFETVKIRIGDFELTLFTYNGEGAKIVEALTKVTKYDRTGKVIA